MIAAMKHQQRLMRGLRWTFIAGVALVLVTPIAVSID